MSEKWTETSFPERGRIICFETSPERCRGGRAFPVFNRRLWNVRYRASLYSLNTVLSGRLLLSRRDCFLLLWASALFPVFPGGGCLSLTSGLPSAHAHATCHPAL